MYCTVVRPGGKISPGSRLLMTSTSLELSVAVGAVQLTSESTSPFVRRVMMPVGQACSTGYSRSMKIKQMTCL